MDNLQVFTKDKTFTGKITKADKIENICGVECYEENQKLLNEILKFSWNSEQTNTQNELFFIF